MKCRLEMVENHVCVTHSQVLCSLGTVSWVARCGNTSGKLSCAITSGLVSFSQSELSRWSQSTCRSIRHLSARKSWSCQFSGEHWPPTTSLRFSHLTTIRIAYNPSAQWLQVVDTSWGHWIFMMYSLRTSGNVNWFTSNKIRCRCGNKPSGICKWPWMRHMGAILLISVQPGILIPIIMRT